MVLFKALTILGQTKPARIASGTPLVRMVPKARIKKAPEAISEYWAAKKTPAKPNTPKVLVNDPIIAAHILFINVLFGRFLLKISLKRPAKYPVKIRGIKQINKLPKFP